MTKQTYLIINGTDVLSTTRTSIEEAHTHAVNICDHSKPISVHEITNASLTSIKALQRVSTEYQAHRHMDVFVKEYELLDFVPTNDEIRTLYLSIINALWDDNPRTMAKKVYDYYIHYNKS